tara:strand:- start:1272 stop:2531 length:1260 start_codon:yes stop_codon:yes gene_type:complete
MASSKTYCTVSDMKDIFPNIDEYDNKTPLIGWETETFTNSSGDTTYTYYVSYDSGQMTQLFIDGKSQQSGNQVLSTSARTAIDVAGGVTADANTIVVDSSTGLSVGSYIKIGSEILAIQNILGTAITVLRARLGTSASSISDNAKVFLHFNPDGDGDNLYDSDNDFVILKYATDPINHNTETGADWSELRTRVMANASRYFDSRVDANLPREQWKDREGNFDYLVVRTTALIACAFLIKANSPQSEDLASLVDEYEFNIAQINDGKAKLAHQNTSDSSKGVIRTVTGPADANPLRIVDTRGNYYGTYELYKVYIDTGDGGAIGTAKYSVKSKNSDGLKQDLSVDSEVINGDWQTLGGGLQIRFAGADDSAIATQTDEWEIECHGAFEETENSTHGNTKMTRTDRLYRPFNNYFRKNIDI